MTSRLAPNPVWAFRADGSVFDLACPRAADVDLRMIAGRLSRLARFNGAPETGAYSIAQHCVLGARAIEAERKDPFLATLFLLHDAHESVLGDETRPKSALLDAIIPGYAAVLERVKAVWDDVIYDAFGLPGPSRWTRVQQDAVSAMDGRMAAFEARILLGEKSASQFPRWAQPRGIADGFRIWPAVKAEMEFVDLAHRLIGEREITSARLAALRRETVR